MTGVMRGPTLALRPRRQANRMVEWSARARSVSARREVMFSKSLQARKSAALSEPAALLQQSTCEAGSLRCCKWRRTAAARWPMPSTRTREVPFSMGVDPTRDARVGNAANVLCLSRNAVRQCGCTESAPGASVRPEAERLGCDAYFDEERAERAGETHHGGDEQDGYGSRQVDGDERGCKQRHHDE